LEGIFPAGADRSEVEALNKQRAVLLERLYRIHGVSIWDVYDESGIGQERNALAKEFVTNGSSVLDVGTGRGYFAFACARRGSRVTAVDIMDGDQRVGWWKVFAECSLRLGVGKKVGMIRASASRLPVEPRVFETVTCVHAMRNFLAPGELKEAIREMYRTTARGGKLVLVESVAKPESGAEEVYLAYLRLRKALGWETGIPEATDLELSLKRAGFSEITSTTRRFSRDYAPVEFPSYSVSDRAPEIKEEHRRIEKMRLRYGIRAPPVAVVSGVRF